MLYYVYSMTNIDQNIYYEIQEPANFYNNYSVDESKEEENNQIIDNISDIGFEDNNENVYNIDKYNELSEFYTLDENVLIEKTYEYSKYTIKELLLICEYYNIQKIVQQNKLKKTEIIDQIIWFESQRENIDLIEKRLFLWKTMSELKKDKILRKFIVGWKNNE